jgi:twitching motility protein PilT
MSILHELLKTAIEREASDVHLKPFQEPFFRIHGHLVESGYDALQPQHMGEIVADLLPAHLRESFARTHEADFSHQEADVGRFRVNVFVAQGVPSLAMRHVKTAIPTFEQLRLPPQLSRLAHVPRGIILLSGTTGSGKSTTLAAVIGEINRTQRRRIITVEDPVEYVFLTTSP